MNTEEKADKRLAVRVTESLKDAFNEKARKLGKTESQALMALVLQFIGGEVAIENDSSNIKERLQRLEDEFAAFKQANSGIYRLRSENSILRQKLDSIVRLALESPPPPSR